LPTSASDYRSPSKGKSPDHSHSQALNDEDDEDEDEDEVDDDDDGFGDDFDDFEQGQEAGDDDFGDFDSGYTEMGTNHETSNQAPVSISSRPPIPSLDWSDIDNMDELNEAIRPYLAKLYPDAEDYTSQQTSALPPSKFLSDRSLSLYSQLVAPPPLAPPDWLRSRIRRMFLVSLGVPVDLDEILPASKQKKLVLPSMQLQFEPSPRGSTDSRHASGAVSRLKEQNDSSISVDSSGKRRKGRKEEAREPDFDTSAAMRIAQTTESRLNGMEDEELKEHVRLLVSLTQKGDEALEYWQSLKDGALKEKEAFEGVIENLVKHARKTRK